MSRSFIYLDNHATTRVDPRVREAMLPFLDEAFGNPSNLSHVFGRRAHEAVEHARQQIAALVGAEAGAGGIVFTSGASESNHLALVGALRAERARGRRHVVTQSTEHASVLKTLRALEGTELELSVVGVDPHGRVDLAGLERAVTSKTLLVSVMLANNEVGTVQPLASVVEIAQRAGALVHCDAAQGLGWLELDVAQCPVDLVSLSGHKTYGPKGVGALYVGEMEPPSIAAVAHGGGQERGLRAGTLNVPGIVGMGRAAEIMEAEGRNEGQRIRALRDRLQAGLVAIGHPCVVHGAAGTGRHPGNLGISFANVEAETLISLLDDVAISTGSACSSGTRQASHVLTAMGVPPDAINGSLRFGVGRFNTEEEIDRVIERVAEELMRLRGLT